MLCQELRVLMERTLVPVFLQECLLAFRFRPTSCVRMLKVFLHALRFRKCSSPLDLLPLKLASSVRLFLTFYTTQFSQAPSFKLFLGIESISIVDIRNLFFLLLYRDK